MVKEKHYIITGGKEGSDRLKKLLESTRKDTFDHVLKAGLKKDMSVLDIACGNGQITKYLNEITGNYKTWGLDYDPEMLEIAEKHNKDSSIHFFEFDISKDELEIDFEFDFIFIRYLLTHIPNPKEVLNKVRKLLKEGGILYIEDIDFSGYFCYPPNKAFNTYVKYYQKLCVKRGGNPLIGLELYDMMLDKGFRNVQVNSSMGCFKEGTGKEIALITFESIYPKLVSAGLLSSRKAEITIHKLRKFTSQKNSIISNPRMFHCYGMK